MNWKTYTVICDNRIVTINSCNGPLGVFRGVCHQIKVTSWKTEGRKTIFNNNENYSVEEWKL